MQQSHHPLSVTGLINLGVVYLVWSSTYLAMRILVSPESGFSPFTAGATRMLISSVIILAIALIRDSGIMPSCNEILTIILTGALFWVSGNAMIMWGEQHASSGLAALFASTTPIWAAAMESVFSGRKPSLWLIGSLFVGLAGIAVLMGPSLLNFSHADIFSGLALICASISIAAASVIQSRHTPHISLIAMSGWQHLSAGLILLVISLLLGDKFPHPGPQAITAMGYLIIFASVIAFTSYIIAIKLLPINIVMTYAYVNPVLALFLGWWLLNEPITYWTVTGTALVLTAIVGVFHAHIYSTKGEVK